MVATVEERGIVRANKRLTDRLWLLDVEAPETCARLLPGQFVHLQVPGMEGHILRRPFSVYYRDADARVMTILYQVVGFGSRQLTTIRPGTEVSLMGPIGTGWAVPADAHRALLVAGGVGAAPLYMHAEELVAAGIAVDVVLGAQTADALVCEPRYTALLGGEPYLATDDGSRGHAGFVTDVVSELIAQNSYDYAACCGPEPMMRIVSAMTVGAGIPSYVSLEKRMACGIGACLGCIVETVDGRRRSCVDGPIFDAGKVVWA